MGKRPTDKKLTDKLKKVPTTLGGERVAAAFRAFTEDPLSENSLKIWVNRLDGRRYSPLFENIVQKLFPAFSIPETSRRLVTAFSSPEMGAPEVVRILKRNPYLLDRFRTYLETRVKRDQAPKLENAVVLMGLQRTRDFIVSLQVQKQVLGGVEPNLKPEAALKFAHRTEEFLVKDKFGYAESAFECGLLFDVLSLLIDSQPESVMELQAKKKLHSFLAQIYLHGLKTATIATEMVKMLPPPVLPPGQPLRKAVFAAGVLHDIGKVALSVLEPKAMKFFEMCESEEVPRQLRHFAEREKFGITHAEIGGLLIQSQRMSIRLIESAVIHHHDLGKLSEKNPQAANLAQLIAISSNMAHDYRKVDRENHPLIKKWKGLEYEGFPLSASDFVELTQKIQI